MRVTSSKFCRMGNNASGTTVVNNRQTPRTPVLPRRQRKAVPAAASSGAESAPGDSYGFDPASLDVFNPATGTYQSPASSVADADISASISVAETLEREMGVMEPAVLADTLWAYTLSRDYDPGVYEAVTQVVSKRMFEYDPTSLIDVLCAMAEAGHEDDLFYSTCAAYLSGQLRDLPPSALSNLVWCAAFLRLHDQRDLLEAAAAAALPKLSDFSPADLSKLVAGLAQALPLSPAISEPPEPFAIIEALQPPHEDGAPVNEGQVMAAAREVREALAKEEEAATKAAYGFDKFFDAAAKRFITWMSIMQLPAESVSQVVWSYMSLDLYRRDLFDAARTALMAGKAAELSAQPLSNVVWAYAVARASDTNHRSVYDVNLLEDLFNASRLHMDSERVKSNSSEGFSASALVTMLMALSRAPHYDASFYSDLARALTPKMAECGEENPTALVMTAWALGRMQHRSSPKTMQALCEEATKYTSHYDSEDLIHLASAMAATGVYHDTLMRTITASSTSSPQQFDSTQLLDLVRIIAALQHNDQEYYEAAQATLLAHVNQQYRSTDVSAMANF